eukprot:sb/3479539/
MGVYLVELPLPLALQLAVSLQLNLYVGLTGVLLALGVLPGLLDGRNSGDYPVTPGDLVGPKYVHAPDNLFTEKVLAPSSWFQTIQYNPLTILVPNMSTLRLAKKVCIVLKFSNDSHSLILQIIDPSLVSFCVPNDGPNVRSVLMAIRHHTHSQRRLFWVAFPVLKTANFREPNRKNARFDPIVSGIPGPLVYLTQSSIHFTGALFHHDHYQALQIQVCR